jgi:hypothetical protein
MFCNSDSWDSAIILSEGSSRRLLMGAFYFLYSRFPLFPECGKMNSANFAAGDVIVYAAR